MIKNLYQKSKFIIVNLLTFLILAGLLEGLVYLGLIFPRYIPRFTVPIFQSYYLSNDRQIIQVTPCARYDSSLFYLFKPGSCYFSNREFHVRNEFNKKGLRDDDESLMSPKGIVLGDSYAMGWGVNQDESFPQLLEHQAGYPILNAGVSSFGTARELILLRQLPTDSLKFIVFQYHGNDYEENLQYINHNYFLPIRKETTYDSIVNSINHRRRYYPFKHLYGTSKSVGKQIIGKAIEDKKKIPPQEEALTFLKVLQNEPLLKNLNIIVFKIDDHDRLNDHFVNAVDSINRVSGFNKLDITTVRISDILKRDDYFILDDHINSSGHLKIAEAIKKQALSKAP